MSKRFRASIMVLIAALAASPAPAWAASTKAAPPPSPAAVWVIAYYPGWVQGDYPPAAVDYRDMTVVDNFALVPRADGTLDAAANQVAGPGEALLVHAAHAAGCKAMITVGGEASGDAFAAAFQGHEDALISNIAGYVAAHGYDGVDIDMEPIERRDASYAIDPVATPARVAAYQGFIRRLRAALRAKKPSYLLTAAAEAHVNVPPIFAPIAGEFDRIDVMTYDLSGTWDTKTGYDSSLYSAAPTLLSCNSQLAGFYAAGIPKRELGIGIDFSAFAWHGATGPGQPAQGGVKCQPLSYTQVLSQYYRPAYAHWDAAAQAPYLLIPASAAPDGQPVWLPYENQRSAAAKIRYAKANGLGSVIVWQIGDGLTPAGAAGRRDGLMRSVGVGAMGR